MGYNLKIGELTTEVTDDGRESIIWNSAESVNHDNAPAYGEPTDHSNIRWPSYTSWSDFARFVGLYDFFFDKHEGIMRQHSGCFPIKQEHIDIVHKAYKEFYEKYPNAIPGYPENEDYDNWPEENSYAVRLEWLVYWMDWAHKNCKNPVFANS
jgi:hypothetical protein